MSAWEGMQCTLMTISHSHNYMCIEILRFHNNIIIIINKTKTTLISGAKEATALSQSLGWMMKPDGEYFRRVVPSPPPQE